MENEVKKLKDGELERSLSRKKERDAQKSAEEWNSSVPGRKPPSIRPNRSTKKNKSTIMDESIAAWPTKPARDAKAISEIFKKQNEFYKKISAAAMNQLASSVKTGASSPYIPLIPSGASGGYSVGGIGSLKWEDEWESPEPEDFGCMWCGEGFPTEEARDLHEDECGE